MLTLTAVLQNGFCGSRIDDVVEIIKRYVLLIADLPESHDLNVIYENNPLHGI